MVKHKKDIKTQEEFYRPIAQRHVAALKLYDSRAAQLSLEHSVERKQLRRVMRRQRAAQARLQQQTRYVERAMEVGGSSRRERRVTKRLGTSGR